MVNGLQKLYYGHPDDIAYADVFSFKVYGTTIQEGNAILTTNINQIAAYYYSNESPLSHSTSHWYLDSNNDPQIWGEDFEYELVEDAVLQLRHSLCA